MSESDDDVARIAQDERNQNEARRVYLASDWALLPYRMGGRFAEFRSGKDASRYVDRLLADPEFVNKAPATVAFGPTVSVLPAPNGGKSFTLGGHIYLDPEHGLNEMHLLHEIGHVVVLCESDGWADRWEDGTGRPHGPRWVKVYVALIEWRIGADAARDLSNWLDA